MRRDEGDAAAPDLLLVRVAQLAAGPAVEGLQWTLADVAALLGVPWQDLLWAFRKEGRNLESYQPEWSREADLITRIEHLLPDVQ